MINILLSVKQPFSGLIMDGKKTWELRKNAPRVPKGEGVTLWLYESGQYGARGIIGKCRIVSYVALRHMPFGDALGLLIKEARMTPEQKAFYEYGKARVWLKAHRSKRYFVDVPDMGLYAWHIERDMRGLDALIRDAWKKRATCRAWNPPEGRQCENCLHKGKSIGDHPCFSCTPINGANNWEPRKEER